MLRQWAGLPGHTLTVYRPSFLIGDSTTGYTTQFGGFYQLGWLVSLIKERYRDPGNGRMTRVPLRVPGRSEDAQNIVPVDFVSRVVAEVIRRPQFHGRVYHLTNPDPPTNGAFKGWCEEYFGLEGGRFVDPSTFDDDMSPAESLLWNSYHLLRPRVLHSPVFDMANTLEVMRTADIAFPTIDRQRAFSLFDYASSQQWGRGNGGKGKPGPV